jgi:hypothetical protein
LFLASPGKGFVGDPAAEFMWEWRQEFLRPLGLRRQDKPEQFDEPPQVGDIRRWIDETVPDDQFNVGDIADDDVHDDELLDDGGLEGEVEVDKPPPADLASDAEEEAVVAPETARTVGEE